MRAPSPLRAAHSTDTEWFAIDDEGHVAFMDSGEPACAPLNQQQWQLEGEPEDALRAMPSGIAEIIEFEPRVERLFAELALDDEPNVASPFRVGGHGLFLFDAGERWRWPSFYERAIRPLRPLHERDLPEAIARVAVRLPGARFAEMPLIQPADFAPMRHWGPYCLSVRRWCLRPASDAPLSLTEFEANARRDEVDRQSVPGREIELDVSAIVARTLSECARSAPNNALSALVRGRRELLQRVLTEDELRWLLAVYERPGDEIDEQLERLAEDVRARQPVLVRREIDAPLSNAAQAQLERKSECEKMFARGAAPLAWASDPSRRFIVRGEEWLALATREDLACEGPMSVSSPTPSLLRALAARAQDVIAAESIAREITASRGGDARVVYWREASADEIETSATLRDDGARGAALRALGFAMDAVVTRVAAVLVARDNR